MKRGTTSAIFQSSGKVFADVEKSNKIKKKETLKFILEYFFAAMTKI